MHRMGVIQKRLKSFVKKFILLGIRIFALFFFKKIMQKSSFEFKIYNSFRWCHKYSIILLDGSHNGKNQRRYFYFNWYFVFWCDFYFCKFNFVNCNFVNCNFVILGEPNQFICTGALVEPDLVVTSASCTLRMFETGVDNFELVLGDSNLNIDLPFGVQVHEISQVIVHENYRPDDSFHYEDIGNKQTCCKNVLCIISG